MKRIHRLLLALAILVMMLCALCVFAGATELKTGIGEVEASALRVREKPDTDAEVIATAYAGDDLVIIRKVGDWYLVNYNLQIGYVHADYVEFKDKANVKIGYASFDLSANVRSKPTTESSAIAQAPAGETCFIIGFNNCWYKVSYEGDIGYVRSDLLTLLEMPYSNAGSKGNTYKEGGSSSTGSSSLGSKMAAYAKQYVGYSYVYGGASPSTGFDCSGLVYYVAKQCGYKINRTADMQLYDGTKVGWYDLKPGDIMLFARTYSASSYITHSGIYIGNGYFVHAANSSSGVVITSIFDSFYSSRFVCGRRLG